jgi:hypothetical protein
MTALYFSLLVLGRAVFMKTTFPDKIHLEGVH